MSVVNIIVDIVFPILIAFFIFYYGYKIYFLYVEPKIDKLLDKLRNR